MKKTPISARFVKMSSEYAIQPSKIEYSDEYLKQSNENKLPYYLIELFNTSSMHRAIIEKKVNIFFFFF